MRRHSARILRKAGRRKVTSVLVTATLAIVFMLFVMNSSTYEQANDAKHASDGLEQVTDDTDQASDVMEHPDSPGGLSFSGSGQLT